MQHSDLDSKRIAVLLSGGVDSSVVVYEFARLGLHPDCFYIKIGPEEEEAWDCSSEEDLEMATAVAHKYGCNLEVIDCHREYWDQVTRYTMEKVMSCATGSLSSGHLMKNADMTTTSLPPATMPRQRSMRQV